MANERVERGQADRRRLPLDRWSTLDSQRPETNLGTPFGAAGWQPRSEWRRLDSYERWQDYDTNNARRRLPDPHDDDEAAEQQVLREYGDARLIVSSIKAALLGRTQTITVAGAEEYDPDLPEDAPPERRADNARAQARAARLEALEQWATDERLRQKLFISEGRAVLLGDTVYTLEWDQAKGRPRLRVWHPGLYFPVLDSGPFAEDYPRRVHFAWEEERYDGERLLHRVTYNLGEIDYATVAGVDPVDGRRRSVYDVDSADQLRLIDGDTIDRETFRITRRYPWSEEPSHTTCYLTHVVWNLGDQFRAGYERRYGDLDLDVRRGEFQYAADGQLLDRLDLGIDFLPVIHVPNTPAGEEHYGESSLAAIPQLLDDLHGVDTDTQEASATTGLPVIGLSGDQNFPIDPVTKRPIELRIRPGRVVPLGNGGSWSVLSTAEQLAALRELGQQMLERLSRNARVPLAWLGQVQASDVPSGFALLLSFAPLSNMIEEMRSSRGDKHGLLLKFLQRMMMLADDYDGGPEVYEAGIELGAYLPDDQAASISKVRELYAARLISLETAIAMLKDAGIPIDDIAAEIDRIEKRDYEAASRLADATGDTAVVRELLGLEPAPPPVAPVVVPGATALPGDPAAPAPGDPLRLNLPNPPATQ